ncbi:prenyltransferase [Lentisphaera profundi]|uniref:Prenyltransferase n=1 Tax=Lentisphaera profundi TaxID=1658616 RepID=A0ABY7VVL5_9BACT|nr:prenyltransferase [Lentisphaera profundi]WDE98265.1 prenyltransferase [Lentisphaera profundi]
MKYTEKNEDLINWMKVMRMSQGFFFISAMPVLLGTLLIYQHHQIFNPLLTILILMGCLLFHLGADMINEYHDHISGNDALVEIHTPFSGGTRVLEEGKLAPKKVLKMSYLFFAIALAGSCVIAYLSKVEVLIFALLGLISCWGYSAPPLKFSHRGLGELVIFLNNGLFIMCAMYYSIVGELHAEIIFPSFFLGFLGFAIILMNEIPDYSADKQVQKNNLIVRLGIENGFTLHRVVTALAFLSLLTAVYLGNLPPLCQICLVYPVVLMYKGHYRTPKPADLQNSAKLSLLCKGAIETKFKSWCLLMTGFIINLYI